MSYTTPHQGKQTLVEAGGGYPSYYKQVNTYSGSQRGWLIDTVAPDKVKVTQARQLERLAKMIAEYEIACTNPELRILATQHYLKTKLLDGTSKEQ